MLRVGATAKAEDRHSGQQGPGATAAPVAELRLVPSPRHLAYLLPRHRPGATQDASAAPTADLQSR